jgi:predicted MFS family arabinose efflux permease
MQRGWKLVNALAAAQLVSWGSIYYSFSLFVVPMEHDLGWSRTALNGALSAGLLVSGLAAYPVGAWIDRGGGRAVMTAGSVLGAVMLAAWSEVADIGAFYVVWLGLGLALAATLYDPVFAVVTRLFPESYGTRITVLTLVGGFASTVFIPLTQLLIGSVGWRHALVALALANVVVCVPVHAFGLRERAGAAPAAARQVSAAGDEAFRRALRHPAFWGLALSFTAYAATLSALTFHVIPLLTERGIPTATIVAALAAYGPAQVAGRTALLALRRRATTALAGRVAFLAFPAAIAILLLWPAATAAPFAFTILWGGANGIITIVRGTAVPELMWREGYGAINGALALPANLARGLAPYGAALIWSMAGNYDAVLWAALAGSAIAAGGFWYAAWRGSVKERR